MQIISSTNCLKIVKGILDFVDPRLMGHGERTAFLVKNVLNIEKKYPKDKINELFLLSLFHDIGAYKTEEINDLLLFENSHSWNHAVYGYLFLKFVSPLKNADAVLYHHVPYHQYKNQRFCLLEQHVAGLIHLADRIEILSKNTSKEKIMQIIHQRKDEFSPYWVDLFEQAEDRHPLLEALQDGSYEQLFEMYLQEIQLSEQEKQQFLQMVAYSIDFRSEFTVIHTITTVSISLVIAKMFGMNKLEQQQIYYGALLHDIGKVETPISILEKPGRLTEEEMVEMRHHVVTTRELLEGKVNRDIVEIAARHHEKLDGSGYPMGLTASEITLKQQIVAVADIVSALIRRRSYKDAFQHDKTKAILQDMKEKGQLMGDVVSVVIENFEYILRTSAENEKGVMELYNNMKEDYVRTLEKIGIHDTPYVV